MAHRPIQKKKLRRLRKALRRTPEGYIDLVRWLKDRGHAQTTGQANKIILAGRVRSESHKLGIMPVPYMGADGEVIVQNVVAPHVPAVFRKTLRAVKA